ncbi:MAG: hypothetical protein ACRD2P_16875 [Terriglobia bacterium]
MFLLAGTATNEGPEAYPVTLYTVGSGHRLERFKEVTTSEDGLYAVSYDYGDKLYVSYPPGSPTTVSVIHMGSPSTVDKVEFNPKRPVTLGGFGGVAAGEDGQSYALYLLVAAAAPRESATLVSVAGNPPRKQPPVTTDEWDRYKSFRFVGCPGGPTLCLSPELQLTAGRFLIGVKSKQIEISTGSPSLSNVEGPERFRLLQPALGSC